MIRALLLVMLVPLAARAQLVLSIIDGTSETTIVPGSEYQLRSVEVGEELSVRLRVHNVGASAVDITTFFVDGPNFVLERPLPPYRLQAGDNLNGTLRFTGTQASTYSATVLMNSVTASVKVNVLLGAKLTFAAPCATASSGAVDFGTPYIAQTVSCAFTLKNENAAAVAISTMAISGAGYTLQDVPTMPLTLAPSSTASFTVQLIPQNHSTLPGTLTVNTHNYSLTAIGVDPPLLDPIIDFESSAVTSGQQRRVTMRLASPSLFSSAGLMTITFQPSYTIAADDPGVGFLETNSRQVSFTLQQGQTAVLLNNSSFVTLQTGTTAGTITIALSGIPGGFAGSSSVTLTVPPAMIALDKTVGTRFLDRIELVATGYDNTFSIGSMLFRFYDSAGQQLAAAMPSDFTQDFRKFYTASPGGSTFKVTLTFPLSGDASKIASMDAEFANTAGTTRISKLTF
jgi:hypothetical protein